MGTEIPHGKDQERLIAVELRLSKIEDKIDGISSLLTAWNTGKGVSAFVIGLAKISAACGIVWAVLKNVKWGSIFL